MSQKVTEIFKENNTCLFSFEVIPPLKGESIDDFFSSIDPLIEFNPIFINVTYHREEYVYKKKENGLLEKISVKKRPGTVGICAAIKSKYNIPTIPHLICGGFTKEETENALIDLNFLGIKNLLVLRGDPIKSERSFVAAKGGHSYAYQLLEQVTDLNKGIYQNEMVYELGKTDFCAGVAGYPEKHIEAPNLDRDIDYLKQKIDCGAEYVITQMFFDNEKYFKFLDLCEKKNINVPIIPGLKPISSKKQVVSLPKLFHVDIPEVLAQKIYGAKSQEEVSKRGIDACIKQSLELKEQGVPCLHYYSMNRSKTIKEVCKSIF